MSTPIKLGTSETTSQRATVKVTERIDLPVGEYVVHGNRRGQRVAAEHVLVNMQSLGMDSWGSQEVIIVGRAFRADGSLGAEQRNRAYVTSRFTTESGSLESAIADAAVARATEVHGTPADVVRRALEQQS